MKKLRSDGFTIVELLIATVVFSIVLLTISAAIIQIGRIYFKGITEAQTQEAARTIVDSITQAIQLTPGQVTPTLGVAADGSKGFCIDTMRYSYQLGQQRTGDDHSLVADQVPAGCNSSTAQSLTGTTPTGSELLGDNMRLAALSVTQPLPDQTNMFRVTARVVYGDNDLLCNGKDAASCSSNTEMSDAEIAAAGENVRCKDVRSGTQFCAVSELSTIVERRLKAQ